MTRSPRFPRAGTVGLIRGSLQAGSWGASPPRLPPGSWGRLALRRGAPGANGRRSDPRGSLRGGLRAPLVRPYGPHEAPPAAVARLRPRARVASDREEREGARSGSFEV